MSDTDLIARHAVKLSGEPDDYDALLLMCRGKRFVLIGEATHGSREFYRIRAGITKRLVEEQGFSALAVEADWPDAFRVNHYLRGGLGIGDAESALSAFTRFPTWMWRNTETRDFVEWLRDYNLEHAASVGFYGLDLYSLNTSMDAVIGYLEKIDPAAALRARKRYGCFESYGSDPQAYGYMTAMEMDEGCKHEIIAQLVELQQRNFDYVKRDGALAEEEFFSAEQNARLVKNAESYYRAMFRGRPSSWNIRDTHMADTLDALAEHVSGRRGEPARIVVWAHNSHIGDASATESGKRDELNIGQLSRERHPGETLLVGFSTYSGTVSAASDWDMPVERKRVRAGLPDSVETLFHQSGLANFMLNLRDNEPVRALLAKPRLHRAIGVIYRPDTERWSHYFSTSISGQYDAMLHIDTTHALEPLEPSHDWHRGDMDETYPSGL